MGWGDRRPPLGTQVDWSHPLASRLVGAYAFAEGGGTTVRDVLGGQVTNPVLSGATWASGVGLVTNSAGAGAAATTLPRLKINPPLTVFWKGQALAAPVANAGLFTVNHNANAASSPYVSYCLNWNGTPVPNFAWNDGTTLRQCAMTGSVAAGERYSVAASMRKSAPTDLVQTYLRGIINNTAAGGIGATIAYGGTSNTVVGQTGFPSGTNSNHRHEAVYVWNRVLSAAEVRQLEAEPYAMFLPARRRVLAFDMGAAYARKPRLRVMDISICS